MEPNEQEAEYLSRSRKGDLPAFEHLVRLHQGWLRAWLGGQLFDRSAADDLAQETFITAYRRIGEFRGDGTFESWLRGIAQNHLRNFIRKKRHDLVGDGVLEALLHESADRPPAGTAALDALADCLAKMDGRSRSLLESRYLRGETVREIAATTGRGYSALTMSLHRLRESLKECVKLKLGTAE